MDAVRAQSTAEWLTALAALYAEVDALYAGWSCANSSECCRFGSTGRQPFVTEIELLAIRSALAANDKPATTTHVRRARPLLLAADSARNCPLLDADGRCSVYAQRPLGCRTFYCGRARRGHGPEPEALQALLDALQLLAARHRLGGECPRPLSAALEDGWG